VQLLVGRAEPIFPLFIMARRLPTKQLLRLGGHAIHVLKYVEKAVHPRWPMTFEVAKRAVGVMVLLLTVVLLLTPVPLSNVAPAMVISLISLAYVEEDGLVLSAALLAAIILIGIGSWPCENSSARTTRRNISEQLTSESQIILHTRGSMPCWRIVFSTFR
jgi:hypothetical protein